MSPKMIRFADEYLLDFNGTAAAIRAGYSQNSSRQIAAENLSKPAVQALIKQRQDDDANTLQLTRQRALETLLDGVSMAKAMKNPAAMIQGMSQVAKMLGFTAPPERKQKQAAEFSDFEKKLGALTDIELHAMLDKYKSIELAN